MIAVISISVLVITAILTLFTVKPAVIFTGLGLAAAGIVTAAVGFIAAPTTSTTSTYSLRPLSDVGAASRDYISTAAGSTSYAYDDNGTLRTGSTTTGRSVEVRHDGGSDPRIEITRRKTSNEVFVPGYLSLSEQVVFHIPAGSALSSAAAG